jgi:hypothetical protein
MSPSPPRRATWAIGDRRARPRAGRPALRGLLIAAATALLLFAAACGGGTPSGNGSGNGSGSSSSPASTRPSTPAIIKILYPPPGATVTGTSLTVRLALANATLEPPGVTTTVVPTEGHIHLSLDGSIVSMTGSLTQTLPVTPGQHLLSAEFVANDHAPFYPRDIVSVEFTDVQ